MYMRLCAHVGGHSNGDEADTQNRSEDVLHSPADGRFFARGRCRDAGDREKILPQGKGWQGAADRQTDRTEEDLAGPWIFHNGASRKLGLGPFSILTLAARRISTQAPVPVTLHTTQCPS